MLPNTVADAEGSAAADSAADSNVTFLVDNRFLCKPIRFYNTYWVTNRKISLGETIVAG